MRDHLDTLGALRAVAEGRLVPRQKYAALLHAGLIKSRGQGRAFHVELTNAGRARLASPPPAASREALMPHPKEHPLAHRVVVPHYATDPNAAVYVIDWLDRLPEEMRLLTSDTGPSMAYRARTCGQDLPDSGVVLAVDGRGRCLVHHAELPAYEFEPVGSIS